MGLPTVIVGAGLAGLVCARRLSRSGVAVQVLEASDGPGGRTRTDEWGGYRLDRGFQVVPAGYSAFATEIDIPALRGGEFAPGALVHSRGRLREFRSDDPFTSALSRLVGFGDNLRLLTYCDGLARSGFDDVFEGEDRSAEEELRAAGFSDALLDRFVRPFFGGVFLDRSLSVSAQMLRFVWKAFLAGPAVLPAEGVAAVPRQVLAALPEGSVRYGARAVAIERDAGAATGVRLEDGTVVEASGVVVATDGGSAAGLLGLAAPEYRSSTCVYFGAPTKPYGEPLLALNHDFPGRVNHLAVLTNLVPGLAPAGRHLVSATVLGKADPDDGRLARSVLYELAQWFPRASVRDWEPLGVVRIPQAQPVHEPGFNSRRTATEQGPGLWAATDTVVHGSLEGAVRAGLLAAQSILRARVAAAS